MKLMLPASDRGRVVHVMAQILQILMSVSNAVMRPARHRSSRHDGKFGVARCIGSRELHEVTMQPPPGPRDCRNRSHCNAAPGCRRVTKPLDKGAFADRHEFPNPGLHASLPFSSAIKTRLVALPLTVGQFHFRIGASQVKHRCWMATCTAATAITCVALDTSISLSDAQPAPRMTRPGRAFFTRLRPWLVRLPVVSRPSTTMVPALPAGLRPTC